MARRPSVTRKTAEAMKVCVRTLLAARAGAPAEDREAIERGVRFMEQAIRFREESDDGDESVSGS